MNYTATATISRGALRHNLAMVRALAPHAKVMAMVKANAYGHGLISVAEILSDVEGLGVARLKEAILLRQAGIETPIILLEGFNELAELPLLSAYKLGTVIHHVKQVQALEQATDLYCPYVWIKINTGMNRLGFPAKEAFSIYQRLKKIASVAEIRGVMSHFANSEDLTSDRTENQSELFHFVTNDLPLAKSLANSGAILAWPKTHLDWVRPGLMLYGVSPFPHQYGHDLNLLPVMTLTARLITISQVKKGDHVGYNGIYTCKEDMPIGIVSAGYGDGYPRYIQERMPILVQGIETEVIGRVSMDMLAVDLRPIPTAKPGDVVTLWGPHLPVERIALSAKTSPYELLAGLTGRVEYTIVP